jgi:hypothetical protein
MTIYQCTTKAGIHFEAQTESEALRYLQTHGGGVYRNILHNFSTSIDPMPATFQVETDTETMLDGSTYRASRSFRVF